MVYKVRSYRVNIFGNLSGCDMVWRQMETNTWLRDEIPLTRLAKNMNPTTFVRRHWFPSSAAQKSEAAAEFHKVFRYGLLLPVPRLSPHVGQGDCLYIKGHPSLFLQIGESVQQQLMEKVILSTKDFLDSPGSVLHCLFSTNLFLQWKTTVALHRDGTASAPWERNTDVECLVGWNVPQMRKDVTLSIAKRDSGHLSRKNVNAAGLVS